MAARSCLRFCLLSLSIVLGSVANAGATPITWTYEGSLVQALPSVPPLPIGTPVTFAITADPAVNVLAGSPLFSDFMGVYYPTTVFATMAGVNYTVGAAFEVNLDAFTGAPQPGVTNFRELYEATDQGFFWGGGPSAVFGFFQYPSDPSSPALLMPFPTFSLNLVVPIDSGQNVSRVGVSGHLVPEPFSGTLLSLGLAVAAIRKRFRRA